MKSFLSFGSINLTRTLLSLAIGLFIVANVDAQSRTSGPELLRYAYLVALYEKEKPSQALQKKLTQLLTTPFVNNSIHSSGAKSGRPATKVSADSLRVATWNIERG